MTDAPEETNPNRPLPARRLRFGELLVHAGVLNQNQLRDVLKEQKTRKLRLGDLLVEKRIITEEQLVAVLSAQLNLHVCDLDNQPVDAEVVRIVPKRLVEEYTVFPVVVAPAPDGRVSLYLAMADPTNQRAIQGVNGYTRGHPVIPVVATTSAIERAIARYSSCWAPAPQVTKPATPSGGLATPSTTAAARPAMQGAANPVAVAHVVEERQVGQPAPAAAPPPKPPSSPQFDFSHPYLGGEDHDAPAPDLGIGPAGRRVVEAEPASSSAAPNPGGDFFAPLAGAPATLDPSALSPVAGSTPSTAPPAPLMELDPSALSPIVGEELPSATGVLELDPSALSPVAPLPQVLELASQSEPLLAQRGRDAPAEGGVRELDPSALSPVPASGVAPLPRVLELDPSALSPLPASGVAPVPQVLELDPSALSPVAPAAGALPPVAPTPASVSPVAPVPQVPELASQSEPLLAQRGRDAPAEGGVRELDPSALSPVVSASSVSASPVAPMPQALELASQSEPVLAQRGRDAPAEGGVRELDPSALSPVPASGVAPMPQALGWDASPPVDDAPAGGWGIELASLGEPPLAPRGAGGPTEGAVRELGLPLDPEDLADDDDDLPLELDTSGHSHRHGGALSEPPMIELGPAGGPSESLELDLDGPSAPHAPGAAPPSSFDLAFGSAVEASGPPASHGDLDLARDLAPPPAFDGGTLPEPASSPDLAPAAPTPLSHAGTPLDALLAAPAEAVGLGVDDPAAGVDALPALADGASDIAALTEAAASFDAAFQVAGGEGADDGGASLMALDLPDDESMDADLDAMPGPRAAEPEPEEPEELSEDDLMELDGDDVMPLDEAPGEAAAEPAPAPPAAFAAPEEQPLPAFTASTEEPPQFAALPTMELRATLLEAIRKGKVTLEDLEAIGADVSEG